MEGCILEFHDPCVESRAGAVVGEGLLPPLQRTAHALSGP